jgi:hypothetical protein
MIKSYSPESRYLPYLGMMIFPEFIFTFLADNGDDEEVEDCLMDTFGKAGMVGAKTFLMI